MLSSDFLKTAEVLGLGRQVRAAKTAAAKSTWNSTQTRSGSRPLHVETMLRKEKDGTLTRYNHKPKPPEEEKTSALSQPGGADYSEPGTDPSAAKFMAPQRIPSREDSAGADVKRQDARDFTTTLSAPGVFLGEVGPQPGYIKTSGMSEAAMRAGKLLTGNENAADLAGLGLMAVGGVDKLQGELRGNEGVLGEKGQIATDLGGLGLMALPQLKKLTDPRAGRLEAGAVLGGLGALAIPAADDLQAHIRSKPGGEDKHLLGHRTHELMDLAGYGTFGALSARDMVKNPNAMEALHLAGYGTLAAPHIENVIKGEDEPKVLSGKTRAATDLAGLGMLALPAAMHLKHAGLDKQALLERLVRLGATDIPGTPRMFMRHRSPEELGQLQQGVTDAISKVKEPLRAKGTGVVERLASKLPDVGGKVKVPFTQRVLNLRAPTMAADAGKWAVNRGLDHPDAFLAHVAVGGALPLVPGAGWVADAGAVKLKQLAERLIDTHLPVPLHA